MAGWFKSINLADITKQVNALTENITEGVNKMAHDLQENIQHLNMEAVTATLTTEQGIMSEQDEIRAENEERASHEVKILPWETANEDKSILMQELMERVLSLSLEESNFTTPPPAHATYDFDLQYHISTATRMLALDPNLAKMHARLVNRVKEQNFWLNYFYRVNVLRSEAGVEPLTAAAGGSAVHSSPPVAKPGRSGGAANSPRYMPPSGSQSGAQASPAPGPGADSSQATSGGGAGQATEETKSARAVPPVAVTESKSAAAPSVPEEDEYELDMGLDDISQEDLDADDVDDELEAQIAAELGEG